MTGEDMHLDMEKGRAAAQVGRGGGDLLDAAARKKVTEVEKKLIEHRKKLSEAKDRLVDNHKHLLEALLPKQRSRDKVLPAPTVSVVGAFALFVLVRSFHPIIIDASKTDGRLAYGKATPCVVNSAVDVIVGNTLAVVFEGPQGLKRCWDPVPLKVFSAIAVVFAVGDFLEMQSLSVMGGAAYQLLLQSKLIITALIMWAIHGRRQTGVQWNILLTIAMAMSAFVIVDGASSQGSSFQRVGLLFVALKAASSCSCAVLAERYLKGFKDLPIYIQVAQLKLSWFAVSLLLTLTFDRSVVQKGFWSGWDGRTHLVALSWVCKGWSTFLLLKNLDSVLKNIGEAVAILVIYLFDVLVANAVSQVLPVDGREFHLPGFLMVIVVFLTVLTYTWTPGSEADSMHRQTTSGDTTPPRRSNAARRHTVSSGWDGDSSAMSRLATGDSSFSRISGDPNDSMRPSRQPSQDVQRLSGA